MTETIAEQLRALQAAAGLASLQVGSAASLGGSFGFLGDSFAAGGSRPSFSQRSASMTHSDGGGVLGGGPSEPHQDVAVLLRQLRNDRLSGYLEGVVTDMFCRETELQRMMQSHQQRVEIAAPRGG
jgi:hypothetical protein